MTVRSRITYENNDLPARQLFNFQEGQLSQLHPAAGRRRIVGRLHPLAYVLQTPALQDGHLLQGDPPKFEGFDAPGIHRQFIRNSLGFDQQKLGI